MKKALLLALTLAFGLGATAAEAATHHHVKKAVHAKHGKTAKHAHAKHHKAAKPRAKHHH